MTDEQTTTPSTDNLGKQEGEFGRFKTSEELVKAYASLEREFTKRSQRLKALEQHHTTPQPIDWEKKVDDFITKYPASRDFLADIGEVFKGDNELAAKEDCLEKAYLQVLSERYRSEQSYAEDSEFLLKYAPLNADVRDAIISDYVASLNQPIVRTTGRGGETPIAQPRRPKTVEDAGSMALKILKNNMQ